MNRSSIFIFLGITCLCLTTLLAQHLHLKGLRRSIQDTTQRVTQLDSRIKLKPSTPDSPQRSQVTGITPRSIPSKTRLQMASIQLDQFIKEKNSQMKGKDPFTMLFSPQGFLSIIKDLDSTELLQLEQELSSKFSPTEADEMAVTDLLQTLFLGIAADDNPLAILNSERELDSEQVQMFFSSLVRKDPEEARRWLDETLKNNPDQVSDLGTNEQGLPFFYTTLLLSQNIEAGLQAAKDYEVDISSAVLSEETNQKLREALSNPNHAEQKEQISLILLQSALAFSPSQAIEEARQLELSHQELLPLFTESSRRNFPSSQHGDYLDWMVTSAQEASQSDSILRPVFNHIQQWTNDDYEASAEWLTNQSPSPVRDIAIEGFTYSTIRVDPESAMLWVQEIQNDERRANTLERTLNIWRREDSLAAEKWEQEHSSLLE